MSLYHAYIHTYVNYANLAWAGTIRTNLKKIHSQQNHAICIIFRKDKFSHTKELFEQNKVFNVYELNILNNLIFMHRVKTESAPAVFLPKFEDAAHPYPVNFSKLNYIKPTSQLSGSKYRISIRGPVLWNEFLTDNGKEIENLSLFKSKVKSKLVSYGNEVILFY